MWRTCKKHVIAELGIPEQEEIVHLVQMSDLQKFFYATEHEEAANMFRLKARKLCRDDVTMSKMNPHTLNVVSIYFIITFNINLSLNSSFH